MIELLSAGVLAVRLRSGTPWPVIAFLLLAAGLAVYGWRAAAKRRRELLAWATSHQLVFSPGRRYAMDGEHPEFSCLHQGDSRYAFNFIGGRWGERVMLGFDYHYCTGSGKNRQTHVFSAAILDSDVVLQPLFIRPEGFFDKISEFFGADDIDFESAEFSKRFYVKAPNKRWAYDVIHARAMEFLMASPPFKIQFGLRQVICYRDQQFAPADFGTGCTVVAGLLDLLPEYVIRQQGTGGRGPQGEA